MEQWSSSFFFLYFFIFILVISATTAAEDDHNNNNGKASNSIVFATLGRSNYAFDIFTLPISSTPQNELQITDGQSINFNGFFAPPTSSSLLSLISNQSLLSPQTPPSSSSSFQLLLYITERDGSSNVYLDAFHHNTEIRPSGGRRSILEIQSRIQIPLLLHHHHHQEEQSSSNNNNILLHHHHHQEEQSSSNNNNNRVISMKDRPSVTGELLIYVSTHEDIKIPRKSWAAVYSTHLKTAETKRLTPYGVADFSPSISPSGIWTAVASSGEKGWDGENQDLETQIFIFKTSDGSERIKLIDHGGWPCWFDDFTIYFHRTSDDGWWSIYKAMIQTNSSVVIKRVTPPGFHAFTPAVSDMNNKRFIAMATRRPTSDFRHIELFDLDRNRFVEITKPISPKAHHYNPFFSFDGSRIGYHKCRGSNNNGGKTSSGNSLLLENIQSPDEEISLFRIDGSFPSFSPNGDQIAYAGFPGLYVVNSDGSNKREIFSGHAFSTAWDWKRKGVVYTSTGPTFASERTQVDIISVTIDGDGNDEEISENLDMMGNLGSPISYKKLTNGGQNNAFPSPSPDGKFVVFRSGRSGHKNLYIMDALDGEKSGIQRLTEGKWTDTMCNWSPNGEWIAFASDRHNPGGGSFAIYFIHPNGTGLKKVAHSGEGGRTNHPWFSPDSGSFVFTSDYAAVSAEPIANPHHYQPYGDIFMASSDGTGIQRLTHNSYEDGTPAWGPTFMKPVDVVEWPTSGSRCSFDDCHWLGQSPNHVLGRVSTKADCI